MANAKGKLRRADVLEGTAEICRELGVSRNHLWMVRTGQRKSMRLAKALEARGIRCKTPRRRGNSAAK